MSENLPSCPTSVTLTQSRAQQMTQSPFTKGVKIIAAPGAAWKASVILPKMAPGRGALWRGFFTRMDGMIGTFWMGDHGATTPQGTARGTGSISGAEGDTEVASTFSGSLLAGDYIECNKRLYIVANDATDGGPLKIWPPLRDTGGTIQLENAKGTFRLATSDNDFDVELARTYQFSFECIEDI